MFKKLLTALLIGLFSNGLKAQNPWNGKLVLQGFYWDYENSNYVNSWANYLTELSPRLRGLGIDNVWIPPTVKNASTYKVGYSPFDHYDLGDKFQKGSVTTRVGTKDDLLRMVAVMHANGLGVIQDVVLNHASDAGALNGEGGQDPEPVYSMVNESGYKNFRYVSYATPATNETAVNYLARSGRWPKNYENFHPNQWTNTTTGNWAMGGWGPDLSYEDGKSYGLSTNAIYNPAQYLNYNITEARKWMIWLKKQTGVDGFRWDAVKHFPHWVVQDLSWNVKYNAGWANGGANMFNVGEYVGSAGEMDQYINDVKFSNGGSEDLVGTFDFALRGGLYGIITGDGNYNLGDIPGIQQANRYRTVPFVNNHDTFRPATFDANGDYVTWNTGNELAAHINPDDGRIQVAYAIAMAVDGSPQIFFEDLFDMSTTTRTNHLPSSVADLPVRDYLANLMWCHQKLSFKAGAYKVRWQAQDALVIERSTKAIIAVNDNWTVGQTVTVQTDFGNNVQLHDYSGANANDVWTDNTGKVTLWIPPCNGSNVRRGYCVWGPAGISGGFSPAAIPTTQEWEMADDLGDSNPKSLKQGGAIPDYGAWFNPRTVGKIYAEAGKNIHLDLYPTKIGKLASKVTVGLYDEAGTTLLSSVTGTGNLILDYVANESHYYVIKAWNNQFNSKGQNVFVKATYTAPQTVSDLKNQTKRMTATFDETLGETESGLKVSAHPNPANSQTQFTLRLPEDTSIKLEVLDLQGRSVGIVADGVYSKGEYLLEFSTKKLPSGVFIYRLVTPSKVLTGKLVKQ
jgi:alpha-amylase